MRLLRAAQHSRGGVLLVEGRFGTGKTWLLDRAADVATDLGFTLMRGVADEPSRLMPLASLMSALGESIQEFQAAGAAVRSDMIDLRLWLLERLQDRLEQRAARGPVLITLDDLHWADPTTFLAVRSLIPELSSYPLVWMLSCRTDCHTYEDVERLFARLEKNGAVRIVLDTLDRPAVGEIVADVLGAYPEPDLLALVGELGDNLFVLVELLRGLHDEGAVEVVDGRARLVSRRVPERVHEIARRTLAGLSPDAQRLLRVGAVLGRSFPVDDLADMLGEPVSRLVPPLNEAEETGVLVPSGEVLRFRHDVLWRAVTDTVTASMRRALHRQAGDMLLKRHGSAIPAVTHLMSYARRGDREAMAGLDRAARELLASAPHTAADVAIRTLELTSPGDPDRFERTVTAVYALTIAGRLTEAMELAHRALDETLLPRQAARLHCELAYIHYLSGHTAGVVAEAESVLREDDLSDELRGLAQNLLFRGLLAGHDYRSGQQRAEALLAVHEGKDDPALVGAHMLMSYLYWADGRADDAIGHVRDSVRIASAWPIRAHRSHPRLQLAVMLGGMGRFEEAESTLHTAAEEIAANGDTAFATGPLLFRAQLRLAEGRFDDAVAEAEAGLATADGIGAHAFSLVGIAVLAIVAVRKGDLHAAAEHVEQFRGQDAAGHGVMLLTTWGRWAMALAAEAQGDREQALAAFEGISDEMDRGWLLMLETGAAAWLTRMALAVADTGSAEAVVATAERLARDNPAFPALGASAAHARGLLRGDAESLGHAVATYAGAWPRASATEDLGVLRRGSDPAAAIRDLDRALEDYQRIGALRDAARVRARLRALGVRRRRLSRPDRPASGWPSLTDTERNVATLVAQGLTNPQVAARMYVSAHTVKFHLRQVFRKLGIASRVELVRAAAEHTEGDGLCGHAPMKDASPAEHHQPEKDQCDEDEGDGRPLAGDDTQRHTGGNRRQPDAGAGTHDRRRPPPGPRRHPADQQSRQERPRRRRDPGDGLPVVVAGPPDHHERQHTAQVEDHRHCHTHAPQRNPAGRRRRTPGARGSTCGRVPDRADGQGSAGAGAGRGPPEGRRRRRPRSGSSVSRAVASAPRKRCAARNSIAATVPSGRRAIAR